MKNLLKLTLVVAGLAICGHSYGQNAARTAPVTPTPPAKQDTIKKDAKTAPAVAPAKKDAAAPTGTNSKDGGGSGNKMAINEQGVPTKTGPAKAAKTPEAPPAPPTPDKKKE